MYSGATALVEAEACPTSHLATKMVLKFGAAADKITPMVKNKQSNIKDFLLPSFSLWYPPQMDPVNIPITTILAEKNFENIN